MALVVGIVRSPEEAFRASLGGLEIWWKTVFPGLLPPLMLAELLAASGLLHGIAALGSPLFRRLFRLPAAAGWVAAFGWTAGLPAGARETARLRERGLVRGREAESLLLLSHMPNPFLVIVVVGSGFLQAPAYGWAIAAGLWISGIATGMLWPRLSGNESNTTEAAGEPPIDGDVSHQPSGSALRRAYRAMQEARLADARPFGKQTADAVTSAVATLFAIGGLMMMSAVLLRIVQTALPGTDAWLTIPSLYEMHLGAYASGRSALFESAPAKAAALIAAALAWSGLSGLLQARAAWSGSRFPWPRFIAGRLLHAALALVATYPLAIAAERGWFAPLTPVWRGFAGPLAATEPAAGPLPSGWALLPGTTLAAVACLGIFVLLALLAALISPRRRGGDKRPK
ncbi:nucleoside recognition domain-containing protein [Cohnella ginsengisoli]|uniref:Nucleoside recognition domain-containing protein n=1 Tax=Cohnella ginsengisoli TaxID=425004 RepID=A0A9X4KNU2_9BACL|nr:nucleoside recognition domain-containing protein [Cohnella ginsengisoli]MDG0793472.1 nucleoside recognition domain-containing protein [Cohnella ginsengisoli]